MRESAAVRWVVGTATNLCTTLYIMVSRWFSRRCSRVGPSPAKSGEHGGDTAVATIVITAWPSWQHVCWLENDFVLLFDGVWIPDDRTILHCWPHQVDWIRSYRIYATFLHCFGQYLRLRFKKFSVLLAFLVMLSTWASQSSLSLNVIPRYLACATSARVVPVICPQEGRLKSMNSHDVTFCWVDLHTPYFCPGDKRW